jgi:pimeloyl-[acyl-carrier protein] synthase
MPKTAGDLSLEQVLLDYGRGRLSDPYPLFKRLRDADPVYRSEGLGTWIVSRYDHVQAGLGDPRLGNDRIDGYMRVLSAEHRRRYSLLESHISNWLGFTDPPKHTRLRGHMREFFTPQLPERMRPLVERVVNELVVRAEQQRTIDAVADFAFPLPAAVVYDLMGIGRDRQGEFKAWIDAIVQFPGNIGPVLAEVAPISHAAVVEMERFFEELTRTRVANGGDDLVSRLALLWRDGAISNQEIVSLCTFLFVAGHETTVSLIANALVLLFQNPTQLDRLRREPRLAGSAIEEFLRFESPIQLTTRLANDRVVIGDQTIEAGETVTLANAAANRDDRHFADPDRLDIARTPNRHLAFGWAAHFCLGAPLARLEAQVAITTFFERFPNARLMDSAIEWLPNMSVRCPVRLLIDLGT